jgi:hypothetical protein
MAFAAEEVTAVMQFTEPPQTGVKSGGDMVRRHSPYCAYSLRDLVALVLSDVCWSLDGAAQDAQRQLVKIDRISLIDSRSGQERAQC